MRNRIVASWSRALLVTECPAWSGSLITANLAADYGKPVFAVPGPIDKPTSAGCNQLIRNGSTLVTDSSHILNDLGQLPLPIPSSPPQEPPQPTGLSQDESTVYSALGTDEASADSIIETTRLPAHVVTAALMKLEMKQLVRALPGFRYTRR